MEEERKEEGMGEGGKLRDGGRVGGEGVKGGEGEGGEEERKREGVVNSRGKGVRKRDGVE